METYSPPYTISTEPQPSSDAGKKDDEGVNKESGIDDQERPKNNTQDVNTARPSINTATINVNTGSLNNNIVSPIVKTRHPWAPRIPNRLWIESLATSSMLPKIPEYTVLVNNSAFNGFNQSYPSVLDTMLNMDMDQ
ncbi:hypothetical protein Tco_1463767 [Tanacetum coccineum]